MKFQSMGVTSYDPCQLQYNLFCEQLVRRHFGKVQRRRFNLKPIKDDSIECAFKLVTLIGRHSRCKIVESGTHVRFFLSDGWAGRFAFDVQEGGSLSGSVREEGVERPDRAGVAMNPTIRSIEVELCTSQTRYFEMIEEWCRTAGFRIVIGFDVGKGVPVVFAWPGKQGIEYSQQSFDKLPLHSVRCNYSEDVVEDVERLLQYATQVTHGLVVLSGPVGTGKSYLIRSILSELTQRRAVVCIPATKFLEEAGLLTQVVANFQKSTVVLEDVGEVIAVDAATRYVDARANLLNFTEGFLSLLTDAIIVISFNYDIDKIDPAVLRPGRCLARIEVRMLEYEHARELVDFDIPEAHYSLADVYEMRRVGHPLLKGEERCASLLRHR